MISFISSWEIISFVKPDPNIFLSVVGSVIAAAAGNPNGVKTFLANDLSTFPIKGNPFFSNGPKRLPKDPPDCTILCNWVFDNFILAEELFWKSLRSFETFVLVNKNLHGKLFSSTESPTILYKRFKVTLAPFFVAGFNLLSCELDNLTYYFKRIKLSHF